MTIKVGINGFGRIGRLGLQVLSEPGLLGRTARQHPMHKQPDRRLLAYLAGSWER
jgi:glyceraldehyde-3-phosphate dehydrogenase/erythrose-4-phosphate dehydrogenase